MRSVTPSSSKAKIQPHTEKTTRVLVAYNNEKTNITFLTTYIVVITI